MTQPKLSAMNIGDLRRRIREADQVGDHEEQIKLLRQLCASETNDLRSRQKLGGLLRDGGHLAEAVSELQRCASGYAMEGFLNRSIQIVKILIEIRPSDQVALRALQGLYARRQTERPSAGPIPGFEPAPFDESAKSEENEERLLGFDGELTDPNLSMAPRLGLARAGRSPRQDSLDGLEPERDLGELLASAYVIESEHELSGTSSDAVGLPLFGALPDKAQQEILKSLSDHQFASGERIFSQGESEPRLWLIRSGRVEVRRQVGEEQQLLAQLGRGAVLGEMSIFDDSPRSASATALGAVGAYSMSRDKLEEVWVKFPLIRQMLLKNYRVRHLRNLIVHAPFMQHIPEDHRRGVAMLFRVREVPPGVVLIADEAKEDDSGVFGVLGGRVRVEYRTASDELRQLAILGPGSIFGYGKALFGLERPFRYVTSGRTSILRMSPRSMQTILTAHPPLEDYLREVAVERFRLALQIIAAQDQFVS
jgi:CRP-like cAMP-binding protein